MTEIKLAYLSSRLFSPPSLRLTERINSARYLSRSSGVIADNSRSLSFSLCVFIFKKYSSTEESWITKRFSLMAFAETGTFNINDAFAETGTFNINDGRYANKNYLLS